MQARPLLIAVFAMALNCLSGLALGKSVPSGNVSNYAVLHTGTGGHNLQITNVAINGDVGVGGAGVVHFDGPAIFNGRFDFWACDSGQFHNNNGANVGPTSVNYGVISAAAAIYKLSLAPRSISPGFPPFRSHLPFSFWALAFWA